MKFDKPPTSASDLITKLHQRGLVISDVDRVNRYLMHIGYYRLSAYMLPFQTKETEHQFIPHTKFDDILNLYVFDRKLRLHLLEAIERIEISLRAQINDNFVLNHGPHGYLEKGCFKEKYDHDWLITQLTKQYNNSAEVFVEHYKTKYGEPYLPPFWMAIQLLTFKEITTLLKNLSDISIANKIAQELDITDTILFSWARSLSDLRNICAHHSRVWNRVFGSRPKIPKKIPNNWIGESSIPFKSTLLNGSEVMIDPHGSLYYQIVIIWHWLKRISPSSSWLKRLHQLISEYGIDPALMGFQERAFEDDFWALSLR